LFESIKNNNIYKNLYNGEWVQSTNAPIDIFSPVNGTLVGKIQSMSEKDVDASIKASKLSQLTWGQTPINERANLLCKAADLLLENKTILSDILQMEIAKDKKSCII
jgi:NAD-dependent aldehyde dehydrogenases